VTEAGFPLMSKRRLLKSMLVRLRDRYEWGEPRITGPVVVARQFGSCARCGLYITIGARIQSVQYGPVEKNVQGWQHEICSPFWDTLSTLLEFRDDLVITAVNPCGRGKAAGCGHDVECQPIYLVRSTVSLSENHHSEWYCKECVRQ
jgi:hypothetical protein